MPGIGASDAVRGLPGRLHPIERPPADGRRSLVDPLDAYHVAILALVHLARILPAVAREALVHAVADAAFLCSVRKRRRMQRNVAVTLADMGEPGECRRIIRGAFRETWREIFAPARIARTAPARIQGSEHLERALRAKRGVVLWESAGLGQRLAAKHALTRAGYRIHQLHGGHALGVLSKPHGRGTPLRAKVLRPAFTRLERRFVASVEFLPTSGSLAYLRRLQARLNANEIVCITGDGGSGFKHHAVSFLGQPAAFATGMASMALQTGAAILPMFCFEDAEGLRTVVVESPLVTNRERDQATEIVQRYAALLERRILEHPAAFRNWHLLGATADGGPI